MNKGTIKNFNQSKGFGFISTEDGGEIFFHHSAVAGGSSAIREGLPVEFQMGEGPKGKRAENVKILA